jgi:hypothetical protein
LGVLDGSGNEPNYFLLFESGLLAGYPDLLLSLLSSNQTGTLIAFTRDILPKLTIWLSIPPVIQEQSPCHCLNLISIR